MPTYDYAGRAQDALERIQKADEISDHNAKLIEEYQRDKRLEGMAEATIFRNLSRLQVIGKQVEQPFDEMEKEDLKDLVEWIKTTEYEPGKTYSEESIATFQNVIKAFWMWLEATARNTPSPLTG
jgi:tRNA A37 N6-isopentenylltransferase MiaA